MTAFVYDDIELIFIHVPKTGGTSITDCLVGLDFVNQTAIEWLGRTDRRKLEYIDDAGHITTTDLRKKIGDKKYNNFFSFAIMREPYDWLLSLHGHGDDTSGSLQDFENFIDEFKNTGGKLQSDWFTRDGGIDVDYVGNFSHLRDEVDKIVTRIEQNHNLYAGAMDVVPTDVMQDKFLHLLLINDLRQRWPLRKINVTQHKVNTDLYRNDGILSKATKLIAKDLELYEDLFGVRKESI